MNLDDSQENLREEIRGLQSVLSVAQVVVSSLELEEVLQNILYSAMAVLDMPAGSIALFNESGSELFLKVHSGLSEACTARTRWRVRHGGLAHRILEGGGVFALEDLRSSPGIRSRLAEEEGIGSLAAIPLTVQKKVVGILYLDDFRARRFSETRLKMLALLGSFASMSIEHALQHEQTCQLASTDGLTGLYNYRTFKQMVKEELSRTARYRKPMSLILFDIDNFKPFNDTYGHPAGDRALAATAEVMRESLRECDLLFRCGGEEFIALLPETDIDEALVAAERSRHAIEARTPQMLRDVAGQGLTVSIGVVSYPRDGQELEELLRAVDEQLYQAKRVGKNTVCFIG